MSKNFNDIQLSAEEIRAELDKLPVMEHEFVLFACQQIKPDDPVDKEYKVDIADYIQYLHQRVVTVFGTPRAIQAFELVRAKGVDSAGAAELTREELIAAGIDVAELEDGGLFREICELKATVHNADEALPDCAGKAQKTYPLLHYMNKSKEGK